MKNFDLPNTGFFAKGDPLPEPLRKNFSGACYLNPIIPANSPLGCSVSNVTFEPACHNNWHKHPGGQILLVTGGRGWYQEEGKEARELHAGDAVEIHRNVKHWHGAAKDSWFSHISIEADPKAGSAEWLEPVSDQEYNQLD